MSDVNLVGHVISSPTIDTSGSAPFASVYLLVFKQAAGAHQQSREWHRIVAFKDPGEIVLRLQVGNQIAVHGRLQTSVEEKEEDRRTSDGIVAEEIEFLSRHGRKDVDLAAEQALFNRNRTDADLAAEIAALFWRGHLGKP